MVFSRRRLRLVCVWLLLTLVGMQQAIAGYRCPVQIGDNALSAAQITAGMNDCDGDMALVGDPDQSSLCKAHCEQDSRVLNQVPAALAALFVPVLLVVLDWAPMVLATAQSLGAPTQVDAGASPPGSPPRYLSLQVLRN